MTDYGIDTGMVFYMWQEMDKGCANLLFENTGHRTLKMVINFTLNNLVIEENFGKQQLEVELEPGMMQINRIVKNT